MKWLIVVLFITAVGTVAQTAFPALPATSIYGSDPPQNPAYTCPYNGLADNCLFQWTTNTAGMSRVLVSVGNNAQGFYSRWIDNSTITTSHQVVVKDLLPGATYFFGFANCPGNNMPTCNQYSSNWSAWNCSNGVSPNLGCVSYSGSSGGWNNGTAGSVTMPAAPNPGTFPIWRVFANGPNRVYAGHFLGVALNWWVTQHSTNDANINGIATLQVAPITSGVVGTYQSCATPTNYGGGVNSGYYQSGGACGTLNINAYLAQGGVAGNLNIQYPFRPALVISGNGSDTTLNGRLMWSGGNQVFTLQTAGNQPFSAQTITGMQLNFMPQPGVTPGDYSVQMSFYTYYKNSFCAPPYQLGPPQGCLTNFSGQGQGLNNTCGTSAAPISPMDCYTLTYTIHVLPVPANITPPPYSSLTPPTINMSSYSRTWQHLMHVSLASDCDVLQKWNNFGGYHNIGFSYNYYSASVGPMAIGMYDGARSRYEIHDYLRDNITADWQASTNYIQGDMILHAGTYYAVSAITSTGTSGTTLPGFGGGGDVYITGTVSDNQVTWVNIGSLARWNQCASQIQKPYLNWLLFNSLYPNSTLEPNEYMPGRLMTLYRQNDQQSETCLGSGGCSGLNRIAIDNTGTMNPGGAGVLRYGTMGNSAAWYTIRIHPYALDATTYEWMVSHTKQPFYDTMVDTAINQGEYMYAYTPYDHTATFTLDYPPNPNEVACCFSVPIFDFGLLTEALIQSDLVYYAESSPNTLNPIIEPEVARFNNELWARLPTITGNYGWPYSPWNIPFGKPSQANANISPLSFPAIAWQWRMEGNSCQLTNYTGGLDNCIDVLDTFATHSTDCFLGKVASDPNCPVGSSATALGSYAKTNNQTFKWWDWWGWRAGTLSPLASYIDAAHNPLEAVYPDTVGPYHNGQSSTRMPVPSVTTVGSNTTFIWYTYKQLTKLEIGISPYFNNLPNGVSTPPTIYECPSGTSVFDPTKSNNAWRNTCTLTGLAANPVKASTTLAASATNSAGQVTLAAGASVALADTLKIDNEYLEVTAVTGTLNGLTCTPAKPCVNRGQLGSVGAAHSNGAAVADTGTYYWGPQGTDAAGNISVAPFQPPTLLIYPPYYNQTICTGFGPCDTSPNWAEFLIPSETISPTYSATVTITGPAASVPVTLTVDGQEYLTASTSTGSHTFTGLENGTYVFTPSASGYTFASQTQTGLSSWGALSNANLTGSSCNGCLTFASTAITGGATYTISGTVSGDVSTGVAIALTGATSANATTDSSGNYSFPNLTNGPYTLLPSLTGYTFSPANPTVTVSGANAIQNFASTALPPPTYTISGTVSGAVAAGVTISLTTAQGAQSTTTDSGGNYSFASLSNGSYTVTPSLTAYTFTPANAPITISGANVTQSFTSAAVPPPSSAGWQIQNIGPAPAAQQAPPPPPKQ